jgi:hypothetical protein
MDLCEIDAALAADPRIDNSVHMWYYEYFRKERTCGCFVAVYAPDGIVSDINISCLRRRCKPCRNVFFEFFPPTKTFLQRDLLMGPPHQNRTARGCWLCGKMILSNACDSCIGFHSRRKANLIHVQFLVKEVFGRDIGGVMTGYLMQV